MGPPLARRTKRLAARTATSNLRKARKATAYYRTSTNPTGEFQSESASKEKIRASVAYPKVIPWIQVQRPAVPQLKNRPAVTSSSSFLVTKFIRMTDLTPDERDRYLSPQEQEMYEVHKIKAAERKKQQQQQQNHDATNTAHYLLEATSAYTSSTFLMNQSTNSSPHGNLLPTVSHRRRCKRCLEHGTLEQALNCKGRSRRVFCLHFEDNGMAKPKATKKARTTTLETTTATTTPTLS